MICVDLEIQVQTILSFWCCASRALEISRIWTHTCSFSDHWGFASFKFCYFFTSVNPPLYVYSCNKSIGAININTNMSCLSWIFGMKYFVCLLRWLEPDFATEVTIFPLVNGLGVFKMKRVTVRKKRYRADVRQGFRMLHAWPWAQCHTHCFLTTAMTW